MNSAINGQLTLTAISESADREALVDYLAGLQKNIDRDRLAKLIGRAPLVLSRNICQEMAGRIAAEMGKLGAKLSFSPRSGETRQISRRQPTDPESPRIQLHLP